MQPNKSVLNAQTHHSQPIKYTHSIDATRIIVLTGFAVINMAKEIGVKLDPSILYEGEDNIEALAFIGGLIRQLVENNTFTSIDVNPK